MARTGQIGDGVHFLTIKTLGLRQRQFAIAAASGRGNVRQPPAVESSPMLARFPPVSAKVRDS
ncbi:hypothetical protein GTS_36280 [Gandjariella thermophila]|uniref:Uncharacterized protein n=1 Tax=Gandjariella thermophila TaxID=1931992 RepID=A0A4D4J5M1_9PSEU|nr:hypothetical protein GTS_36280 [Gandjariella thermophila]